MALVSLHAPAAAQEAPARERPLKASAEFSLTDQSGNRSIRLLTAGLRLSNRAREGYEFDTTLRSRYGRSDGEVVARNHYGSLALDLNPGGTWSPFVFTEAERDVLRRIDLRFSGGAGAKHTLYRRPGSEAEASISMALLYSRENVSPVPEEPRPDDRDLARLSVRARATSELRPGISGRHVTYYQPRADQVADYLLRSETGLKILLTQRLALSLEYQLNRTSRPPLGIAPDDRLFRTGLIIDF